MATADYGLKIGTVAQQSGLPVKTIRYYADLGLLTTVMGRSPKGYRLFSAAVFARLAFIKRAQSLGLSLEDIGKILSVRDQGTLPCGVIRELLEAQLQEINQQMAALTILKGELQGILSGWQDFSDQPQPPSTICPNLQ
ncbi:heavy metal-responsive transcriptional regulator [Picosynechococcus sp. PCC 7117]|uniref:heavy metal-responsive transcriptional regulator n=1 Tax=Picosynechococcus sp. PCC 7117 TaxID=195498 RepID=UPI000810E7AF|nr:heavy metal-responsive transcriptional regulator [Picosynechococcus sp. PCC 7117]ANV86114.1 heavy metal-responsive transcriptional regulator [Picosynechococcus sp. PCC 7117]